MPQKIRPSFLHPSKVRKAHENKGESHISSRLSPTRFAEEPKKDHPHTAPALLAGLWVLLSMLELLKHVDLNHLRQLADGILLRSTG